jgi:hypothetical protein
MTADSIQAVSSHGKHAVAPGAEIVPKDRETAMNDISVVHHHIIRMRRETRRRLVCVAAIEQITPKMRRIRFTSSDLHDFESLAPDDHVKLFVPNPIAGGGRWQAVHAGLYAPRLRSRPGRDQSRGPDESSDLRAFVVKKCVVSAKPGPSAWGTSGDYRILNVRRLFFTTKARRSEGIHDTHRHRTVFTPHHWLCHRGA